MGVGKVGFEMDGIKDIFNPFGGGGEELFGDYEAASPTKTAFTVAADPAARVGKYWEPAAPAPDAAVMKNFRDMLLGNKL